MLYIVTKARTTTNWHIGEPTPDFDGMEKIVLVQADGDELEHIRENFHGVPYPKHQRVAKWVGEMAEFIALNL